MTQSTPMLTRATDGLGRPLGPYKAGVAEMVCVAWVQANFRHLPTGGTTNPAISLAICNSKGREPLGRTVPVRVDRNTSVHRAAAAWLKRNGFRVRKEDDDWKTEEVLYVRLSVETG